jgi:hypothetical protein
MENWQQRARFAEIAGLAKLARDRPERAAICLRIIERIALAAGSSGRGPDVPMLATREKLIAEVMGR